jgi:hypothetical protein
VFYTLVAIVVCQSFASNNVKDSTWVIKQRAAQRAAFTEYSQHKKPEKGYKVVKILYKTRSYSATKPEWFFTAKKQFENFEL